MGYPRSMFCPTCSQARKKAQKKIYNQCKPARHLGSVDKCENCGKEYIVNSGVQRFCPDCSKDAIKANIKSRKKIYNDANKAQMYAHKEKMRENGHVCVICGKIFDPSTPTVTCSLKCEKELRRRRQNQADIKRGKRALPADARYNSELPQSGIVGVTYHKKSGKWQAQYDRKYIGLFDTIEAAGKAIEQYKKELAAKD